MGMGASAEETQPATWVGLVFVVGGFLWHVRAGRQDQDPLTRQRSLRRTETGREALMMGTVGPHRMLATTPRCREGLPQAKTDSHANLSLPYSKLEDSGAK